MIPNWKPGITPKTTQPSTITTTPRTPGANNPNETSPNLADASLKDAQKVLDQGMPESFKPAFNDHDMESGAAPYQAKTSSQEPNALQWSKVTSSKTSHPQPMLGNNVNSPHMLDGKSEIPSTPPKPSGPPPMNWKNATGEVKSEDKHTNATFRFTDPKTGAQKWVKALEGGGERPALGDRVMTKFGVQNPNTTIVPRDSPEGQVLASKIGETMDGYNQAAKADPSNIQSQAKMVYHDSKLRPQAESAKQYLVMDPVPGQDFGKLSKSEMKQALTDPHFVGDLGKMAAIDTALTGNTDRLAMQRGRSGEVYPSANYGNFMAVQKEGKWHAASIDNEFVSPSGDLFDQRTHDDVNPKSGAPSSSMESTLRALAEGGTIDKDKAVSNQLGESNLGSMDALHTKPVESGKALIGNLNDALQIGLSKDDIDKAGEVFGKSYTDTVKGMKDKLPGIQSDLATTHQKTGDPLLNTDTFRAKLAFQQHRGAPIPIQKDDASSLDLRGHMGLHQTAQAVGVHHDAQKQFQSWASQLQNPASDKELAQLKTPKDFKTAIDKESAKVDHYLQGFNNQGLAHEQRQELKSRNIGWGTHNVLQTVTKTAPKDPAVQTALDGLGAKIGTLQKLMNQM